MLYFGFFSLFWYVLTNDQKKRKYLHVQKKTLAYMSHIVFNLLVTFYLIMIQ